MGALNEMMRPGILYLTERSPNVMATHCQWRETSQACGGAPDSALRRRDLISLFHFAAKV
jgi:hypothetical protein